MSSGWQLSDQEILSASAITTAYSGHWVTKAGVDVSWVRTSNCSGCVRVPVPHTTIREIKPPPELDLEGKSHTWICLLYPSTVEECSQAPYFYSPPVFDTSQVPKIWPALPVSQYCNLCVIGKVQWTIKGASQKPKMLWGTVPRWTCCGDWTCCSLRGFLLWHANNMWFTVSVAVLSLKCLLHS